MRLLLILFLLLPLTGFSQVINDTNGSDANIIGEVKENARLKCKLTWEVSGTDTLYIFTFANTPNARSDYQAIVLAGAKMMNSFYTELKSVVADKSYHSKWSEGGIKVKIYHVKGTVAISTENGYCDLRGEEVDKTFGK